MRKSDQATIASLQNELRIEKDNASFTQRMRFGRRNACDSHVRRRADEEQAEERRNVAMQLAVQTSLAGEDTIKLLARAPFIDLFLQGAMSA